MVNKDPSLPPEGLTYYQLFGVQQDAPESDIQNAYRQLIKIYHPDQWDHWAADDVSARLSNGYQVLTDPRSRQRYNQEGHESYTGETPPTKSEIQEWLEEVTEMVDVQNPASPSSVTSNEKSKITVEKDEFEEAEESMSMDEIFDEVDLGASAEEIFDEVEEAERQSGNDDPSYTDSKSVEDIGKSNDDEQKEPLSHREQVKNTAERRKRERDYTKVTRQGNPEEYDPEEQRKQLQKDDSNSTVKNAVNVVGKTANAINTKLGGDIISLAVRRAWAVRVGTFLGLLVVLVSLSTALTNNGIAEIGQFVPSVTQFFDGAISGVVLMILLIIGIFAVDQYRTEKQTERGYINTSSSTYKFGIAAFIINLLGAILVLYPIVTNNINPIEKFLLLFNGGNVGSIWFSGGIEDVALIGLMMSMLIVGFLVGTAFVSRYVWYQRYVTGYRILPFWWDGLLMSGGVLAFWTLITGNKAIPVPEIITGGIHRTSPNFFEAVGIVPGELTAGAVVLFGLTLPIFLFGIAILRTRAESLFNSARSD